MKKKLIMLSVLVVLLVGCQEALSPTTSTNIDTAIAATESVGQMTMSLGLLMPALLPIGALIVGIAGTAKKMKPKLQAATNNAQLSASAIHEIVAAIEKFKIEKPSEWIALKVKFSGLLSPLTKKIISDNK